MRWRTWSSRIRVAAAATVLSACWGPNPLYMPTTGVDPSVGPSSSSSPSSSSTVGTTLTTIGPTGGSSDGTGSATTIDSDTSGTEDLTGCDAFLEKDCPVGLECVPVDLDETEFFGLPWDDTQCVERNADGKTIGMPCTPSYEDGIDDCARDLYCLEGRCVSLCKGDNPLTMCTDMFTCAVLEGDVDAGFCLLGCDPLGEGCAFGNCVPVGQLETMGCIPASGDAGPGQPCENVTDCAPGLFCVQGDALASCNGDFCCTPYCNWYGDGNECMDPESCIQLFDEGGQGGFDHVGYCGVGF